MGATLEIIRFSGSLPDLSALRAAAFSEGHRMLERLCDDWASGDLRFEGPLEALIAANVDGALAGIGGITREPADPAALRMRRFYVLPAQRRRGIGRALAETLMNSRERRGMRLTVHAGLPESAQFWERLGFLPVHGQPWSHAFTPRAL
jgi:GNAT superfamily N-acetyltransferase